jgi:hypothetical protein
MCLMREHSLSIREPHKSPALNRLWNSLNYH